MNLGVLMNKNKILCMGIVLIAIGAIIGVAKSGWRVGSMRKKELIQHELHAIKVKLTGEETTTMGMRDTISLNYQDIEIISIKAGKDNIQEISIGNTSIPTKATVTLDFENKRLERSIGKDKDVYDDFQATPFWKTFNSATD
jgi:hypothetical protein